MLDRLLDPQRVFWTSIDNRPISRLSGFLAKQRGVRPGLPDIMCIPSLGHPVFVELKSKAGHANKAQKGVREELGRVGCRWFMARSARAALVALLRAGVPLREPWEAPRLEPWEGPWEDPTQRLPQHPEIAAQSREANARYREKLKTSGRAPAPRRRTKVLPEVRRAQVRDAVRRYRARRHAIAAQ
jgi:hypothetical protein